MFRRHNRPSEPITVESSQAIDASVQVDARDLIGLRLEARTLSLSSRRPVTFALAGPHHSRFRGRGMDYQESRHYQPGDDIRNMDWRVTARAGGPHTKVYQAERERPVVVLADFGPTMFFGTRGTFKSVAAARTAALIAWAAVAGRDRVGALIFNGDHRELAPCGGRRGVLRLIRALVEAGHPEHGANGVPEPGGLSAALVRLRRVARPGSLVFVLSDFYAADGETARHLSQLRQHNDLVACQIVDPLELSPPHPGLYGISDGQSDGVLDTRAKASRDEVAAYFARHHRAVEELTAGQRIPLLRIGTDRSVVETLRAGLDSRPWCKTSRMGDAA
jgi:uncharacterized protein (DUF58 family)